MKIRQIIPTLALLAVALTTNANSMVDAVVLKRVDISGASVFSNQALQNALQASPGERVTQKSLGHGRCHY